MRGLLDADERWGVLQLVNDPRLQSLEYVEVPCGNYHPPVRLDWKEGSLKGVWELQAGAHAQFVGGRRLSPLGCLAVNRDKWGPWLWGTLRWPGYGAPWETGPVLCPRCGQRHGLRVQECLLSCPSESRFWDIWATEEEEGEEEDNNVEVIWAKRTWSRFTCVLFACIGGGYHSLP